VYTVFSFAMAWISLGMDCNLSPVQPTRFTTRSEGRLASSTGSRLSLVQQLRERRSRE
jgi:hypothetical protein